MSDKLNEKRIENEPRIDVALVRLGELAGGSSPFKLKLVPGPVELDAAVAKENLGAASIQETKRASEAEAEATAAPTGPASSVYGELSAELGTNLAAKQAAIDAHLAALTEFVGDGRPWTVELAADAAEMDAEVMREADYMKAQLFGTVEEFLGFINHNVRRDHSLELLAAASPGRCIVFKFVAIDDMPRRYLGAFQAIVTGEKLLLVGPGGDFKSNGAGASRISSDLERAVMTAKGEDGPTEKELALAEALGAIAATSSRSKDSGGGEGKTCTKCKGKKFNTCNACHGKGGSCSSCKGSGLSSYKCSGSGGTGIR